MVDNNENSGFQGSLFEEDYLIRTLGTLVHSPEIALTELVANAWDAGATRVNIFIPDKKGDKLIIEDNGRQKIVLRIMNFDNNENYRIKWSLV